jgi:cell division protein FtsB
MVIRRGPRRFLAPFAFYMAATACVSYFLYHAHHGARGLETKQELKVQLAELRHELEALKTERQQWDTRVALMRREEVDSDLLDERVRETLGRVHRNDVVVIAR